MTTKRSSTPPGGDEFREARARVKDISSGLSNLFETMTQLLDEATQRGAAQAKGEAGKPGEGRFKTHFDVRMRTLDDLSPPAKRARPKPREKVACPASVEQHETPTGLMVIVTLAQTPAQDIYVDAGQDALTLRCRGWEHRIHSRAALSADGAQRTVRNGYLTFVFPFKDGPLAP